MSEREHIIQNNLNSLFDTLRDIDSAFAFQAEELFTLRNGDSEADAYMAYEIISSESERIRSLPYDRLALWLHCLSETVYGKLKGGEAEDVLFAGFGFSDEVNERNAGRVSYLKNKFTISAFDKFELMIPDAKSLYADSFEASCEDVYNGICEYCILPVGNSKDGALSVFRNLISKYDLHISATTDIPDAQGTVITLALLTSAIRTPSKEHFEDYRFEFSADALTNDCISGILSSAQKHGLSILSISSMKLSDPLPSLQFTFSSERATVDSFKAFVFSLSAIFPSFSPKGLYRHLA